MKRAYIAVFIFALLVSLSTVNFVSVGNVSSELVSLMDSCEQAALAGDTDTAAVVLDKASQTWNDSRSFFGIITDHAEFEEIDVSFEEARGQLAADDIESFLPSVYALRSRLKLLGESEKINVSNVL